MTTAIIVVDEQNDFCETGALPVDGGGAVATRTAAVLAEEHFDLVVATRDMHTNATVDHFAAANTDPDYNTTWPVHCMTGTPGAELHPAVAGALAAAGALEVHKGQRAAAYSGFEGATANGTALADLLTAAHVDQLVICGLATDYCVNATVLDALDWAEGTGRDVAVIVRTDLIAAVDPAGTGPAALAAMAAAGAVLATADSNATVR